MELTQLKYFLEAAKTENLSQAARNLHISQPSLSKAIQKLEEELGAPLFQRDGRRLRLNQNGTTFLEKTAPAVAQLLSAQQQLSRPGAAEADALTVGVWGESDALTGCIKAFLDQNPGVFFTIRSHIEAVTRLDIRDYDLLLYAGEDEYFRKYRGVELLREEYLLAVPRRAVGFDGPSVDASALSGLPVVSARPESDAERILLARGIPLRRVVQTDDRAVQRSLVSAGVGACFVAHSESRMFSDDPNIRLAHIRGVELNRALKICFKREKLLSETGKTFMRFVNAYFQLAEDCL
jgi:DNA-binding transcriptional LysR family regulator